MSLYYSDDFVTLHHGDCREIADWLTADVLVTDPPYGRSWKQGELKRSKSPSHKGIANDLDVSVRDDALQLWGNRPAIVFGDLMLPPPVGVKQVMVYRKPVDAGVRGATGGRRRDIEAVYLLGPWKSGIGGKTSVICSGARSQGNPSSCAGRYDHPHAKPLDVMEELILMAKPGVIADPFAGSGSTLFAAKLQGRRAIGVELEERYCEIASQRLSQDALPFGESA
jgi:site-specific DNA-methyltransferase (adenine-specific)